MSPFRIAAKMSRSGASAGGTAGRNGGSRSAGIGSWRELHQVREPDRRLLAVDHAGLDAELPREERAAVLGDGGVHLDPHRRPAAAELDRLLDRGQQVVGLVLLDLDVCVAGHAERVDGDDREPREEQVDVGCDQVLEEDELPAVRGRLGRHLDQPGEDADRDLEPGEPLAAPGVPDRDREVEREVRDERERVGGVERERRQGRKDLVLEEPAHPRLALRRELFHPSHADALPVEADEEVLVPAPVRGLDEGGQRRPDLGELPHGREAVQRRLDHALGQLALQPCDPDHEELVQVVREDREELHPLEERVRRVERLLEHAAVELDPAQLPVDEQPGDGRGRPRLPGAVRPGLCLGHSLSTSAACAAVQYRGRVVFILVRPGSHSVARVIRSSRSASRSAWEPAQ